MVYRNTDALNPAPRIEYFCRVTIGDDVFTCGDGKLISASVRLGEGRKTSSCEFEIYDPTGYYADKYLSASHLTSGIDVPESFFADPNKNINPRSNPDVSNSNTTFNSPGNGIVSSGGEFTPPVQAFADLIAWKEVNDGLGLQGYYENNGVPGSTGHFNDADIQRGGGFPASAGRSYNVGRYQFNREDWGDAKRANPKITGYDPPNQDLVLLYKLKAQGVLPYILSGDISTAINKAGTRANAQGVVVSGEWASLPGSTQANHSYTMQQAIDYYNQRLAYYRQQSSSNQQSQPKQNSSQQSASATATNVLSLLKSDAIVSYYSSGNTTASGEPFRPNTDFTAAHASLPFGTLVKVTWLVNNQSVVVKVNDRGLLPSRDLDLSTAAMKALSSSGHDAINTGLIHCKLEIVGNSGLAQQSTKDKAKDSVSQSISQAKQNPNEKSTGELSAKGTQITVELSADQETICAFSYIHTGTVFNGVVPNLLKFSGQSIRWILNRRIKNARYQNITLKGLAQAVCKNHGLTLHMDGEGSMIDFVTQASSDLRMLSDWCNRLGYSIHDAGKALIIRKRADINNVQPSFILSTGQNLIDLQISDKAQTEAIGSTETILTEAGIMKTNIDSDSGIIQVLARENPTNLGLSQYNFVSGSNVPELYASYDEGSKQSSNTRPVGKPVKEYTGKASFYTNQYALEQLTPDTPFTLDGSINFGRKSWFVEGVEHNWSQGIIKSAVSFYIPVAAKVAQGNNLNNPRGNPEQIASSNDANNSPITQTGGVGQIAPYSIRTPAGDNVSQFTDLAPHWHGSGYYVTYKLAPGQRGGQISYMKGNPDLLVYDFTLLQNGSSNVLTPSPVSGVVTAVGGGEGQVVIQYENNQNVRVLHLKNIRVKAGDRVNFGSIIGTQSNTDTIGATTGIHTHITCRREILERYIQALVSGNFQ